jgi:hypothetical protein
MADLFGRGLDAGIELAVETFNETNTEVTILAIANFLNKLKWMGKSDWTTIYLESYIDNLRGNINSRVMARIIKGEVNKIHRTNYLIIKRKQLWKLIGNLKSRVFT